MAPTQGDAIKALPWAATATDYLKGYGALAQVYPTPLDLAQVKLQVLGHALECSLKGWLVLHQALTGKEIKKLGHDLARLAKAAQPYYPPLAAQEEQIAHLTKGYWGGGDKDYQYPYSFNRPLKISQIAYVPPDELAPVVEECNRALSTAIYALKPWDEPEPMSEEEMAELLAHIFGTWQTGDDAG
jgi:hypothetical protein